MNRGQIIFENGTVFDISQTYANEIDPSILSFKSMMNGEKREILRFTLEANVNNVLNNFKNNVKYIQRIINENNESIDYDRSEYCIAGDVVDHRDGRVSVYMAMKTDNETMQYGLIKSNIEYSDSLNKIITTILLSELGD